MKDFTIGLLLSLLFYACSGAEQTESKALRKKNQIAAPLLRDEEEEVLYLPSNLTSPSPSYPWQTTYAQSSQLSLITKEYFRCKGSIQNPPYQQEGQEAYTFDCRGGNKHSLPLRDGEEFIYPILINLLNFLQKKTEKQVIVLSGHRCPEHNTYIDPSSYNRTSKHQIGAEVAFYLQGLESSPEKVVSLLMEYYQSSEEKSLQSFSRYEKPDTNVSTPPWYNKEIFIKMFLEGEGRNREISISHPYISVQVRYDSTLGKRVYYSWDQAHKQFYRW